MSEMTTVLGYGPEHLGAALELVTDKEMNAMVFKGMATAVHDRMLEIYSFTPQQVRKAYIGGKEYHALEDMGWDVAAFDSQSDEQKICNTVTSSQTTIEIIRAGESVDMHTDILSNDRNSLFIPRGYGVSINLVGCAYFQVVKNSEPIDFAVANSSDDFVTDVKSQASTNDIEDSDCDEAILFPGDVILWRQPYAHKVSLVKPFDDYGVRRAIALIREDLIGAKFPLPGIATTAREI